MEHPIKAVRSHFSSSFVSDDLNTGLTVYGFYPGGGNKETLST